MTLEEKGFQMLHQKGLRKLRSMGSARFLMDFPPSTPVPTPTPSSKTYRDGTLPRVSSMKHLMLLCEALLVFLFLAWCPCHARELRADPTTGRVRVLYIGDAMGVPNPFPVLNSDPLLYCTAVYACTVHQPTEAIRKSVRAYMPRTYSKFLTNDVVVLSDANREAFRTEHFDWLTRGVVGEGLGLVMIGGAESFTGGGGAYPTWEITSVASVLPCEMIASPPKIQGGVMKIVNHEDEFTKSLPFRTLGTYGSFSTGCNLKPTPPATLLSVIVRGGGGEDPCLMWWDIGRGRTMAQAVDWTPDGGTIFMRWKHYGDYVTNMMLFLAGQKLPEDLEVVYLVRRRMREANEALLTLYYTIDLVDKLGGNSAPVIRLAGEIQTEKARAGRLYVECRMEESLAAFGSVLDLCAYAMNEAIKARDAASLWIFLTEWCVVTATFILTGSVLWLVMVRRRLYKEVKQTRLIESG